MKTQGFTIIEMFLVLVIMGGLIIMGFRQFQIYKQGSDIITLHSNINIIFSALNDYYRANCGLGANKTLGPDAAALPIVAVPYETLKPYLARYVYQGDLDYLPKSPFLDYTDPNTTYLMQFNAPTDGQAKRTATSKTAEGEAIILMWKAQVAVKIRSLAEAPIFLNLLTGNCMSHFEGDKVIPCALSDKTGQYIVFERLPSGSNTGALTTYWPSMPRVQYFSQIFPAMVGTQQYFLCGS